jgi:hypothetical protein
VTGLSHSLLVAKTNIVTFSTTRRKYDQYGKEELWGAKQNIGATSYPHADLEYNIQSTERRG